jgi:aminotransferase
MVREYRVRRNLFVESLNRIGLPCHLPEVHFMHFLRGKDRAHGLRVCRTGLKEEHVAVVPGSVFGKGGAGHLRCALRGVEEGPT